MNRSYQTCTGYLVTNVFIEAKTILILKGEDKSILSDQGREKKFVGV